MWSLLMRQLCTGRSSHTARQRTTQLSRLQMGRITICSLLLMRLHWNILTCHKLWRWCVVILWHTILRSVIRYSLRICECIWIWLHVEYWLRQRRMWLTWIYLLAASVTNTATWCWCIRLISSVRWLLLLSLMLQMNLMVNLLFFGTEHIWYDWNRLNGLTQLVNQMNLNIYLWLLLWLLLLHFVLLLRRCICCWRNCLFWYWKCNGIIGQHLSMEVAIVCQFYLSQWTWSPCGYLLLLLLLLRYRTTLWITGTCRCHMIATICYCRKQKQNKSN